MIEDVSGRGFSEKTCNDYIRSVRTFAAFIGRSFDTATAQNLRRCQRHQTQSGMHPPSIKSAVSALCFSFTVTLDPPAKERRPAALDENLSRTYNAQALPKICAAGTSPMPKIVADLPDPSCNHLLSGSGIDEYQ
jgi:hypothetical protein